VLRGLEDLFSTILQRRFVIETPLQWRTKPEVVSLIEKAGVAHLLAKTNSCTRPRSWSKSQGHCGACSQCIDRRFSILAAGMAKDEPSTNYRIDLLTADRSQDDDMRLAVSYVDFVKRVLATPRSRFLVEFPEIVSAIGHFPDMDPQQAEADIFDLLQRHALAVEGVITSALGNHSTQVFRNELPQGSLLSMCVARGVIEVAPPSDYDALTKGFIDRLSEPVLEFAIDAASKSVVFRDGTSLQGSNYRVVAILLNAFRHAKAQGLDVPFMAADELARRLSSEEQSMRQQVTRLRSALEPLAVSLGIVLNQNTFIENRARSGYRLNPAARELALADLLGLPTSGERPTGNVTDTAT
jgi:hypothetical protein